ncbi:ESPR-type extended signal peptide-containing protein [Megamonas hypermegale]|uniref:ESPR-type extended signal peptide-containing protein n=1 Tax=Megamonas hypermegale TaxID=158847 RepID=UPI0025A32DBD|nr:ESPR-type extended signal peptide-containing protein [Megamonas hypermegale]MDM8143453.1 ESPR-type extended signal peptide-containing protein [Megamonas hypermegale]
MNRIYKVIWSKVKNQYVVVSELAHSNGKQSSTSKISSVRGSLRAMLAALMVAGGIFSFTPAVYAAQANEASVSVLSDGIFWLQNGDNSIVIDEGNFDTYFVGAVRQADGTYTINGQVVSDKNLYNINDEIGAFVVDNNVYTGEVLDQNSNTVLSMQQRTIVNEDGFYAGNGKGTYNTLSKDGLWVGGTKDGEGFHVDNDGNVRTTGNVMVDGAFSAANGNATIAEDGTTQIQVGSSQLRVADDVAGMSSGNGSVSVSNNSATLSGAGSVVDAGLNGIILTERTGNNSVTVNQDGTTVNGNLNVENGDFSAANGNATIEEDGTTLIQAGSSQLIVNDDVAGMTSGNGSIAVSNNSAEIRGAGNLITADLNGITLTERTGNNSVTVNQDGTTVNGNLNVENGDFSAANGNATIAEDGTTQIQVGSSQLRVTNDVAGMSSGNGSVSVSNNSATISAAGNNLEIGLNGIVTNGAFTAKGTATFEKGADMNGQKITNVQAGEVSATSTDAVSC